MAAKKGTKEDEIMGEDDSSNSDKESQNSQILDNISEESHFDNYEFQTLLMKKIRDMKEIFSEVLDTIQQNALVLYNMQHVIERNFLPHHKMTNALHTMS